MSRLHNKRNLKHESARGEYAQNVKELRSKPVKYDRDSESEPSNFPYLVDDNVDPLISIYLRDAGHNAVHVRELFGNDSIDSSFNSYIENNTNILVTSDTTFLGLGNQKEQFVLYCPQPEMRANKILNLIEELESEIKPNLPKLVWMDE